MKEYGECDLLRKDEEREDKIYFLIYVQDSAIEVSFMSHIVCN